MRYSPCGKYLAVGTHCRNIFVLDATNYSTISICKKHNSFITAFDWSTDSAYIKSICGAYELLFFDAMSGNQLGSGAT